MPFIEDLDRHDYENKLEWNRDWDQPIWRYLDMEQYLSIMHRSSLRFGRADLFADEFEGSVPSAEAIPQNLHTLFRRGPEINNISCWHKSDSESMTMWEIYSNRGVVIKSTPKRLRNAFRDKRKFSIQFTDVQYLDYTSDTFDFFERTEDGRVRGNLSEPFQFKREYYGGENEFRAITTPQSIREDMADFDLEEGKSFDWDKRVDEVKTPGLFVSVDLEELIEDVVVSPYSSKQDFQAAKKLAERKHGLGDLVKLSEIATTGMVTAYHRA